MYPDIFKLKYFWFGPS